MKIGILLISETWGGAEEVVYQLSKGLINKNFKTLLFVNNEMIEYYSRVEGLSIFDLGSLYQKNRYLLPYYLYKTRNKLEYYLKLEKPDLIHAHLETSMIIYGSLYNKIKIPYYITLHGTETLTICNKNKSLYKQLISMLLKQSLNKSKLITSPSKWLVEGLQKEYKTKTIIIPNGVDTKEFRPLRIKKENNVILFVGQFVKMKGIKELINVAKELSQYEFWFAGEGPLAKIINLPNTKNFGFIKRNELVNLYNKATICIFPSYYENMPIVGLEAMACGKAVITTPLGFSEYIKNGKDGLIIPAQNENELRGAIVKLITNKKMRDKLGKEAREKASKYSWKIIINKYRNVYEGNKKW